jgi:hypothetical protein
MTTPSVDAHAVRTTAAKPFNRLIEFLLADFLYAMADLRYEFGLAAGDIGGTEFHRASMALMESKHYVPLPDGPEGIQHMMTMVLANFGSPVLDGVSTNSLYID